MEIAVIQTLFRRFLSEYNSASKAELWEKQRQIFKRFWNDKILNPAYELTVDDTDAIIRLLDTKARGRRKEDEDEAVATTGGSQGRWERLFDSIKNKPDIRQTLDEIFAETDDSKLIGLIDRLEKENKNNKNTLTGGQAVILNVLLFINNPTKFLSVASLGHRSQVMRAFALGNADEFKTYGERIILSNRRIIDSFREKYGIEANPRDLSEFLYTPFNGYTTNVKIYWQNGDQPITETAEPEYEVTSGEVGEPESEVEFALEKHLEDFLVRNWENTDLGRRYELVEEDGKFSQQYPTAVGKIDLLVRDKETKRYVVIELKKGQTSDDTVGQVARYMGWVKKNLSGGQEVSGIIIARSNDQRLQCALEVVPNVELLVYKVSFALERATNL